VLIGLGVPCLEWCIRVGRSLGEWKDAGWSWGVEWCLLGCCLIEEQWVGFTIVIWVWNETLGGF
jgi:hypothetical protein